MKFQLDILSRKISTTLNVLRVHKVIYNQIGSALDILKLNNPCVLTTSCS